MLFKELELLLGLTLALQQLADGPQAIRPMRKGHAAGFFQGFAVVFSR